MYFSKMFPTHHKLKIFVGLISILTAILNRRKLSDLRSISVSLKLAQPLITKLVLRFRLFLSEMLSRFLVQSKIAGGMLLKFVATSRSFGLSDKLLLYVRRLYHKLLPSLKTSGTSADISLCAESIKDAQLIHDESYELMKLWKNRNVGYERKNADYRELKEDLVRAYDNLMLSKSIYIELISYHHDVAIGKRALPIDNGIY
jgi:hypothetical protein